VATQTKAKVKFLLTCKQCVDTGKEQARKSAKLTTAICQKHDLGVCSGEHFENYQEKIHGRSDHAK
jgi:hypothetical protein